MSSKWQWKLTKWSAWSLRNSVLLALGCRSCWNCCIRGRYRCSNGRRCCTGNRSMTNIHVRRLLLIIRRRRKSSVQIEWKLNWPSRSRLHYQFYECNTNPRCWIFRTAVHSLRLSHCNWNSGCQRTDGIADDETDIPIKHHETRMNILCEYFFKVGTLLRMTTINNCRILV